LEPLLEVGEGWSTAGVSCSRLFEGLGRHLWWRKQRIANKEMELLMQKRLFPIRFVRFSKKNDVLVGFCLDAFWKWGKAGPPLAFLAGFGFKVWGLGFGV